MKKFLEKSKWTDSIISIIFILFGIMLILRPNTIMSAVSILLGIICIIIGALKAMEYYSLGKTDNYLLAISIISVILGIIIMFCGDAIFSIFRLLIAVWIIYSGFRDLQTVIIWKEYKSRLWLLTLILSIVMILGGVYVLIHNGVVLQIVGTIITFYGIIDIIENIVFIKKIDNYLK